MQLSSSAKHITRVIFTGLQMLGKYFECTSKLMFATSSQAGSACATTATILMYTILNGKGGLTDGGLTDGVYKVF